jgi:NAD(P)-dependent dehydrogenase (short-subunit alcohol dehydrogenase family)
MSDMNEKVALITGASSGIGWATGEAFAARGAKVVLAARPEHELAMLSSEIESRGGRASFVATDVAIAKDVERMVPHAMETFGRLDYARHPRRRFVRQGSHTTCSYEARRPPR